MDITDYYKKTEWADTHAADVDWEGSLDDLVINLLGPFADLRFSEIVETELAQQRELIESGNYCSAILRQAAFVESLLQFGMIEEIESYQGRELSNAEQQALEEIGNKPTVYMANALGLLTDSEYEAYTKLMGTRNDVAHNWWLTFSEKEQDHFENVAVRVLQTLEDVSEDADSS